MVAAKRAAVQELYDHLRHLDAGAVLALSHPSDGSVSRVIVVKASRWQIKCTAIDLCVTMVKLLRGCDCGEDHAREIAEVEMAISLLRTQAGEVMQ